MAGLSEVEKNSIAQVLNSTRYAQYGFSVKYEDVNNPVAIITFPGYPEYQTVINSNDNGSFTTSECPGIHSDEVETFQRSNFELCIEAIKKWVERIIDRQRDWILDEFGGVADRNPSLNSDKDTH